MTPEKFFDVYKQKGYVREYDDDALIEVRKGDLLALLDVATQSMDFTSGFLTEEQVQIMRQAAGWLGIDPAVVTPGKMICKYRGHHTWRPVDAPPGKWTETDGSGTWRYSNWPSGYPERYWKCVAPGCDVSIGQIEAPTDATQPNARGW